MKSVTDNRVREYAGAMRFFERQTGPLPERETPEIARQRDAEEKANFLAIEAERLKESTIPESNRIDVMDAIEKRYQQWRDEQTQTITALPDPDMQYGDKETVIRLGNMARALHQDVDQIVAQAGSATMRETRRAAFMRRSQPEQEQSLDPEEEAPSES